ncbi:DNA (cytosine-5-)-methyltransferase [Saccharopolyspora rosea]|uniref:DNA (cytosine-5-)-methyltransferase n=1 Tax=Saccharopolyspora rosea TaxID=524884 RepID=A0ABW3FP55_9PSEU
MDTFKVVEICAGAGGQALGLEKAGFEHEIAVELDENACDTLSLNRPWWKVAQGDVANPSVWDPATHRDDDIALLAGGVPCPPFSIAGRQLGANDERDLFAWAVEQTEVVGPRALMLENVRGLSMPRFAGYRQHVLDRLTQLGYVAEWKLLHASDFGVPQLRPRFILVALHREDAPYFHWPEPIGTPPTVGETLLDLMKVENNEWPGAEAWAKKANKIAPTIVGGSKKHGGADLGPTRAKRAWAEMGVDALGIANTPPTAKDPVDHIPKLTCEMVARLQGWSMDYPWEFSGRKTARYRQIGNAFPPPVAHAVGAAIMRALKHEGPARVLDNTEHDPLYKTLRSSKDFVTPERLMKAAGINDSAELERRIGLLNRDFHVETRTVGAKTRYKLGDFKAFVGQADHERHDLFLKHRAKIS